MDDPPTSDVPENPSSPQESAEVTEAASPPPPSGEPLSTVTPDQARGRDPQNVSGHTKPGQHVGGWYSGPWPGQAVQVTESTGAAIGRTAIKAFTALVIIFGLPFLGLMFLVFYLAGISAATGGDTTDDESATAFGDYVSGDKAGSTRLVAVPVIGGILGEDRGGGGFLSAAAGVTYGYNVKQTLLDLADNEDVDGVLLELDSPGGTVFGSKAIADGVAEYQAITGNPVLAYVSGISASGGMYAMAGADEIVADQGTLIGSIGVIFGPFPRYNDITAIDGGLFGGGVTTEGGIEFEYLTAGRNKDLGSPHRDMNPEERKTLEEGLDDVYDTFVAHVAAGRDISESVIKNDLGALIFGEQQALSRGLIDAVGTREQAHQGLAELAGADGSDWRLDRVGSGEPSFFDLFAGSAANAVSDERPQAGPLPSMCTGTLTMLAYHGHPVELCAPLLRERSGQ